MQRDRPGLLLVDRDGEATRALMAYLDRHGLRALWVRDGESALNALTRERISALVFALSAPRIDGLAVLRHALARHPSICAVAIADGDFAELADEAVRLGVSDVQSRPAHPDRVLAVVERGLEQQKHAMRLAELESRLDRRFGFQRLDARSRSMRRVIDQLRQVAATRAPVLLEGEEGTGKSRLAEVVHQNSPRRAAPFARLDCAALPASQLERELFGSDRDAAGEAPGPGRIEQASGGTLYLEDVDRLSGSAQPRLLRLLQDRAFERVGGSETRPADVRLIVSTTASLEAESRAGRFREDLWSRLSLVHVRVPPLRERREDIPVLIESSIREFNREHGRRVSGITPGALERLSAYEWPGNVLELRNLIEGMVVFAAVRRPLDLSDLPERVRGPRSESVPVTLAPGMTVEEAERALIAITLRHSGFDKARAAATLGIGLRTLYRKIRAYGLPERPEQG